MKETEFKVHPIGVVHSDISETSKMPKNGVSHSTIEIFDKYIPALHGLEKFSHLYLMCFFHKSERDVLRINLEKVQFKYVNCIDPPLGVFAGRSPARPNPISITVVRIKSINKNMIEVEHCDAVDQTPVIDIKPYNGGIDRYMNLTAPANVPKKFELRLKWVERIIKNTIGYENSLTVAIARAFADAFDRGFNYKSNDVFIGVSKIPELIDSAIFLTDASFSSGRINIISKKEFEIRFKCGKKSLKYNLTADVEKNGAQTLESKKIDEIFKINSNF